MPTYRSGGRASRAALLLSTAGLLVATAPALAQSSEPDSSPLSTTAPGVVGVGRIFAVPCSPGLAGTAISAGDEYLLGAEGADRQTAEAVRRDDRDVEYEHDDQFEDERDTKHSCGDRKSVG